MVLFVGVLFWKAPWWQEAESSSDSNLSQNQSNSTTDLTPLRDQQLTERIAMFKKNLEMALASFPKEVEVSSRPALSEALKKVENCLQQNQNLVTQTKISYSPYDGDIYLTKAILLELCFKTERSFLSPQEFLQKRNEIKTFYFLAIKAFERPFALTHFRLPPYILLRNLEPHYDQTETVLEDLKKIFLQLEEELHQ